MLIIASSMAIEAAKNRVNRPSMMQTAPTVSLTSARTANSMAGSWPDFAISSAARDSGIVDRLIP